MAEENKTIDPKKHQIAIAKSMGLKQEVINFLEKVPVWDERELYYMCALDRMPLSDLIEMLNVNSSQAQIKKKRQEYLKKMYTDLEPIGRDIISLKEEVKGALSESQSTREIIARNIDSALEKQAAAQDETIRAKNEQIIMLQDQLRRIEGNHLKTEEVVHVINKHKPGKKLKFLNLGKGLLGKPVDTRKFINNYIKNEKMADEQKEYLLDCLEEGMSVKDIEKFASPDLPVEIMKRIKGLIAREGD